MTVNPPHGDLVLSGVSIRDSPNFEILNVKFDSKLTFEDHVRGIVSRVCQIGETYIYGHLCATIAILIFFRNP